MDKREFKLTVYSEIATLVKSLSNPHRLEIIDLLSNGEKSVEQISKETAMTIANASQHLQTLKKSKWVSSRREKNFIFYRLNNQYVTAIWKTLREFARLQLPEIDKAMVSFRKFHNSESIRHSDLSNFEPYVLLDVRPAKEFENGHIADAINVPIEHLSEYINRLPGRQNVVTYCRGPFCTMADEAVNILHDSGFNAYRLEEGFKDVSRQAKY